MLKKFNKRADLSDWITHESPEKITETIGNLGDDIERIIPDGTELAYLIDDTLLTMDDSFSGKCRARSTAIIKGLGNHIKNIIKNGRELACVFQFLSMRGVKEDVFMEIIEVLDGRLKNIIEDHEQFVQVLKRLHGKQDTKKFIKALGCKLGVLLKNKEHLSDVLSWIAPMIRTREIFITDGIGYFKDKIEDECELATIIGYLLCSGNIKIVLKKLDEKVKGFLTDHKKLYNLFHSLPGPEIQDVIEYLDDTVKIIIKDVKQLVELLCWLDPHKVDIFLAGLGDKINHYIKNNDHLCHVISLLSKEKIQMFFGSLNKHNENIHYSFEFSDSTSTVTFYTKPKHKPETSVSLSDPSSSTSSALSASSSSAPRTSSSSSSFPSSLSSSPSVLMSSSSSSSTSSASSFSSDMTQLSLNSTH